MESIMRLANELSIEFIKKEIQKSIDKHNDLKNESSEFELESICAMFLLKRRIKEIGLNKLIEEFKRTNSLHSFFKNSLN